ncbi:hypothetical protein [Methylobacterium tarhaniae]|nr:hypothetical protein [Methylobacterium tarhaniae]
MPPLIWELALPAPPLPPWPPVSVSPDRLSVLPEVMTAAEPPAPPPPPVF